MDYNEFAIIDAVNRQALLDEIEEVRAAISNERLWEFGYDGDESNPHSENICLLMERLDELEEKLYG